MNPTDEFAAVQKSEPDEVALDKLTLAFDMVDQLTTDELIYFRSIVEEKLKTM